MKTISMKELLEKFMDCDTFSLGNYIDDDIIITNEEKDFALKEIEQENKKYLISQYDKYKDKYSLPPFEKLYDDIKRECLEFESKYKNYYMKKNNFFDNSFICDHVGNDTVYCNPNEYFWHFYHTLGLNIDRKEYLDNLMKEERNKRPEEKIESEILRKNLIRYEILFHNHCTESGDLKINYYFKLNEETKKWLLQFKNDFEIEGNLDDLAFYKNGELEFSSCTHEGFNSL